MDPILEFLAIGEIIVNGLAVEAVGPSTNRTEEDEDVVLDDGPVAGVGRLVVESVGHRLLRQWHRPVAMFIVNFRTHQLSVFIKRMK